MKKRTLKTVAAVLLATMTLSACASGGSTASTTTSETPAESSETAEAASTGEAEAPEVVDLSTMSYDEQSTYIYNEALGDFYGYLTAANEAETVSEKFALQAIAEAKLLEAAVLLPGTTRGGNYAISRVARRTASTVLWGNDNDRFHNVIVATEPIKGEDQQAIVDMWYELKGTGTYSAEVTKFLEEKGYELKDTYTFGYSSDPKTWDAMATSRSADSEAIVNTYDGLVEYDNENVMQPALAESWEANEDNTVFTFKIRQGAKWVDSQGRELGEVTAGDFVAGLQHVMDAMGGLEYLISYEQGGCGIVNADQYMAGEVEIEEVGVKAVDDYTLEYTLEAPCTFFLTMLPYNVFAPLNAEYFQSKGGALGVDAWAAAVEGGTCTYGQTPNDIAYCGPYLVTNATAENTIVFKANPAYWNADNITMSAITWMFNDGKDPTKAYNDMKNGVIDGCGLSAASLEAAKGDGMFDEFHYVSDTDATTFVSFFNLNRAAYANFNEENTVVSPQTDEQKAATGIAMRNVHFRRAVAMGLDYGAYNAQTVGEELKLNSVRNTYTPGNFVTLEEDATVDINGTATTYPAGTYYGEIIQAQIDADGVKIKVWDDANKTSDGFAGWYNADNAKEELALAVEELKAQGVEVSKENPIYLDLPCWTTSEIYANRGNAFKQSVESALDGAVIINLVECVDSQQWYYAGYYTDQGLDANYNLYDVSGWGPDYGDPSTYLNTMAPDYAGYMTKCLGIF